MKKIKTLAAAAVVAVSLFSMQGDAMEIGRAHV